jgi:hypothetical protein
MWHVWDRGKVHGSLGKRYRLEHLDIDGRIILKRIFKKKNQGRVEWIDLAHDRHKWPGLVNKITNLRVPQNAGNFLRKVLQLVS